MSFKYRHLAVGGTFDLLHKGHEDLLDFAFLKGAKVSIGITTDAMVNESGKTFVKNLSVRLSELKRYLRKKNYITRSKIVLLDDIYGSTLSDNSLVGLVITRETLKGGLLVNQKRRNLGLSPLLLLRYPMTEAEDGKSISSTRIRQGLIDMEGFSYYKFLSSQRCFLLPQEMRHELSRVHGKLIKNINQINAEGGSRLITVGDETTRNFVKRSILPDLALVDFRINRKDVFHKISDLGYPKDQELIRVENEHGTIDKSLIKAITIFFASSRHSEVIKVDGEEDLAVLPVVLLAPLGTKVFYGQPDQGLVLVEVTEHKKVEFLKIVKRFKVIP